MEPRIQYAKTADGLSIAYCAIGSGPALVIARLPFSHLELEWQDPATRNVFDAVSRVATLVRYDHRGFGLSQRDVDDFSVERMVKDLEAVIERLGIEQFALIGDGSSSPIAIHYAAHHAERVRRLVLQPGIVRIAGAAWDQWMKLVAIGETDWEFSSEAMLRSVFGWEDDEESRRGAALLREAISPTVLRNFMTWIRRWDVSDDVPNVTMPTLLLEWPNATYNTREAALSLAAALPDAQLVLLHGSTQADRGTESFAAIAAFLGAPTAREATPSGTAIILFADIADSTALTERLGDAAFRAKARDLDGALRAIIREHAGTPVEGKLLGDGVLAVFTSARQAIEAALACGSAGNEAGLSLHLGLHAGDVIREEDNVYGGAVNIAARISAAASPGEVLASDVVRSLARTSAGVSFEDRGEQALKGVGEPVRVWAVVEGGT